MNKGDYEWYKSHGICVNCHKEKAAKGRARCLNCLDYASVYRLTYYKGLTDGEKARRNNRRRTLHEMGLCVECGAPADGKSWRCKRCNAKNSARMRERRLWDES